MSCSNQPIPDERRVVLNAQQGDRESFDRLHERYRPIAQVLARSILRREAAEDAVQDAFVQAFAYLKRLDDPGRFGPWLAAIVRNRCRRLAARRPDLQLPYDPFEQPRDHSMATALTVPPPSVPNLALRHALGRLPEPTRQIVDLYYADSWTVAEIASFLALPVTTIKWQLHAGRAALRRALENEKTP